MNYVTVDLPKNSHMTVLWSSHNTQHNSV